MSSESAGVHDGVVVERNPDVVAREFDGLTFIMHPHRRELHHLNESAWFVWQAVDGRRSVGDLVALLCEEYEVTADEARRDVAELLATLLEKDLVRRLSS